MRKYSRREIGFLLATLFRPPRIGGQSFATAHEAAAPTRPEERSAGAQGRTASRTYRADAVILVLGISIFRRAGVGGGRASVEETSEGDSLSRTFFFAGGSDPKLAHGLSRLGWMREVVVGPANAPSEAGYFGVLTSSPEESLGHARESVAAAPTGTSAFSALSGRNTAGHSRSALTHFEFAASAIWSDRALIDGAQSMFDGAVNWRETSWPQSPNVAPPTFLFQVASLLGQRRRRAVGRFVYSEQEYLLELEAQQAGRDRLLPVRGKIRNLRTAHETLFRLWLEEAAGSVLPVRIEFQPRSFLRLTFEALPA